ncbi:apolipoprotein C-II isoform X1 [Tamandua tetradactyla]|uniref:apolipoprotein C-II isoform X1 n=2 Tax=Tamandua tetradactyla TaxID=48850 RepID=UPI004053EE84
MVRSIKPFQARWELVRTAPESGKRGKTGRGQERTGRKGPRGWDHQCSRSPATMRARYFLAVFLVILVLGFEVQGAEEAEDTSLSLLTQVQESLYSYWDSAKAAARELYERTYLTSVDEKLRNMYSQSTAAVSTYAGIMTDQLLTMLKGEN